MCVSFFGENIHDCIFKVRKLIVGVERIVTATPTQNYDAVAMNKS